ncbi:MAG: threonine synthase [Phycisphaerales bacterium]|nr:MAG: threonine synthase [Phycisphaerales bacterium]
MNEHAYQQCIASECGATYDLNEILFACRKCGALLDVRYEWDKLEVPKSLSFFDSRRRTASWTPEGRANTSGVWRFRELLPFAPVEDLVTIGEGQTLFQRADELARAIGIKPEHLFLQYEGFNPSGSFKDNGMAAAFTAARSLGRRRVACASTGNTSASMAMFAGHITTKWGEPIQTIVFVGGDKIAFGKLSQALDYGAKTIQIAGDFDACMRLVQESADRLDLYLMNSVNPFRLEGQKTIMYRVLAGLNWEVPDWIICPGGNLGNSSAFGKAYIEMYELGLIKRKPRLAIINATGAKTLYELFDEQGMTFSDGNVDMGRVRGYFDQLDAEGRYAKTIASAIEIGRPVNLSKALRSLEAMNGVVRHVPDEVILDAKALVGRYGYGCEPASAASVAGLKLLLDEQVISPSDRVACILTGHGLKDPNATVDYHSRESCDEPGRRYANAPVQVADDFDAVAALLDEG